ncbi:MerR family transcriptional regulator [Pectinatus haikarae]|uniref:DNA-binding transcriptional MerR regulator n=1 Tax=Pectinatus haikarae TaxID=349096 RepID=A0ABT9Y753_9FIRM|nr:MerR family transcriptional regulator [Pectinatus haikarae]MDQ0203544.1 DNA-binding transcriptional MerR regulator [Pectinatus haikarae]
MDKKCDNYFTSGELAALYKIPKQTLLYYDRIDLLKPEFVSSNGYRHYAIEQYLTLEIILNLRKLDIPIATIKEYLTAKSPSAFIKLLKKQDEKCLFAISKLEKVHQSLTLVMENTLQMQTAILDQVLLTYEPVRLLCLTGIDRHIKGKDLIKIIARHVYDVFSCKQFSKKNVGWVIDRDEFFKGNPQKAISFYSVYDNDSRTAKPNTYLRPAGLYLKLSFKGSYYKKTDEIIKLLQKFMRVNELEPVGDIFVSPLENHWVTSDIDNYVNRVIVRVKHTKKTA